MSCETIYAFIYRAAERAEQLWRYLTRRHKRRRPRRSRPSQDTIKDRVLDPRTARNSSTAEPRAAYWEGDRRSSGSAHGRCSFSMSANPGVTLAARLAGKTAAETIWVTLAVFARIEPALRKSITFDNDTAFAQHASPRTMHAMTTWFCDAYASWQKGGVENASRSITPLVASPSTRDRPSVRRRNPGHRHHRQSHAQKMPGLQDPFPGDPQRAWQRRANPVLPPGNSTHLKARPI